MQAISSRNYFREEEEENTARAYNTQAEKIY